jgi:diketogulonate reductase-like aldo/keto reductase
MSKQNLLALGPHGCCISSCSSNAAVHADAESDADAAVQLSYLDLYLIHWPVVTGCSGPVLTPSSAETWSALEGCVGAGLTRSIGLSNFSRAKAQQLMDSPGIKIQPAVLQVGGGVLRLLMSIMHCR